MSKKPTTFSSTHSQEGVRLAYLDTSKNKKGTVSESFADQIAFQTLRVSSDDKEARIEENDFVKTITITNRYREVLNEIDLYQFCGKPKEDNVMLGSIENVLKGLTPVPVTPETHEIFVLKVTKYGANRWRVFAKRKSANDNPVDAVPALKEAA